MPAEPGAFGPLVALSAELSALRPRMERVSLAIHARPAAVHHIGTDIATALQR